MAMVANEMGDPTCPRCRRALEVVELAGRWNRPPVLARFCGPCNVVFEGRVWPAPGYEPRERRDLDG